MNSYTLQRENARAYWYFLRSGIFRLFRNILLLSRGKRFLLGLGFCLCFCLGARLFISNFLRGLFTQALKQ